jgi:hypothetical protein
MWMSKVRVTVSHMPMQDKTGVHWWKSISPMAAIWLKCTVHGPPGPDLSILIVNLVNHVQWIRNKDSFLQFEAAGEVNLA